MFIFKVVDDPELMEEMFHFRYEIALESFKGYKENREKIDVDVYDQYSIHFVALDDTEKICAATRFIVNSPIGYPTENYIDFKLDEEIEANRDKLSEISRIFISKEVRGMKNTKNIIDSFIDLIYEYIKLYQVNYIYGALEMNFFRLLQILKIDYQLIGEGAEYYGFRYPCLLKTENLVRDNPRLLSI